jgi:hypothetical protein
MRYPKHECPHPASSALTGRLDSLHQTQSGSRRHRCVACAYAAGVAAGQEAAARDLRTSSWLIDGAAEMCEEGRSAPEALLGALEENQGEHRHRCAVCAWTVGWRDGVAEVRER